MNMIMNPITKEIMTEDMFQSVANWQSVEFVELTNCEEVETETGFALTGLMNGETFKAELTQEEYFEGKCFSLVETAEVTEQIEVESITFEWSESPVVKDNTTVNTFAEAESIIFNIACNKNTGGYDKTKFKITWKDGHTYSGRIDVLSSYTSGKELKKHVEDHCTFFAGLRKAYHETMEEYENTLKAYGVTEDDKAEYKLFLDTYLLVDITSVQPEPTKEIIEELQQTEVLENNSTIETNEVMVAATYKLNDDKNGVEIYFTDKPSEEVRNLLKANKFRWSKRIQNVGTLYNHESTLSLAKQLAGEQTQETTQEPVKVEYDEVFIDDCTDEKYIISQSLIDREHDANWIFRKDKKDYNKELQEMFISYTENVKEVTSKLDNEYYIYKIKSALQSFKKKYHAAFVSWLSAKASQPHWAVSGRGNLNKSRYDKSSI
jgi:hypothetical protein